MEDHQQPSPLLVLAADTLAARVREMLKEIAYPGPWAAADKTRQALDAYDEVRTVQTIQHATEAQDEDCPKTERAT